MGVRKLLARAQDFCPVPNKYADNEVYHVFILRKDGVCDSNKVVVEQKLSIDYATVIHK